MLPESRRGKLLFAKPANKVPGNPTPPYAGLSTAAVTIQDAVDAATNGASLNGFTLVNGVAGNTNLIPNRSSILVKGGGVCGSTLGGGVVSNFVLTANAASGDGGGAFTVVVVNSQLTDNLAINGGAAALINCSIVNNTAVHEGGVSPNSFTSQAVSQLTGIPTDGSGDHADPDGDGMDNWQEFIARTNPTNALSVLKISTASACSERLLTLTPSRSIQ